MRLFTILLFLCSQFVFGQYSLLKDINTEPSGSLPMQFSSYEENVFYFAKSYESGPFDFWVYDTDTQENHILLKEVSQLQNISCLKHGKYLLLPSRSFDSTIVVNMETLDIDTYNILYHNINESSGRLLYVNNSLGQLYFLEILVGDFSLTSIYKLKSNESFIDRLQYCYDGAFYYFVCESLNGSNPYFLYKTDGSGLEIEPIYTSDLATDGIVGIDLNITAINGQMVFMAMNVNTYSNDLWLSDGTAEGTYSALALTNTGWGTRSTNFTKVSDELFFRYGYNLVKTDGTLNGTKIVDSNSERIDYEFNSKANYPVIGSLLIYSGNTGGFSYEPSYYNIVTEEKGVLRDLNSGGGSSPIYFREESGLVFFVANESELWQTNGSSEGTVKVTELSIEYMNAIYPSGLSGVYNEFSGNYYFMGMGMDGDIEPWVVPSSNPALSYELLNVNKSEQGSVPPNFANTLFELNGKVFFTASDGIHGNELWRTDLSEVNTALFMDLELGSAGTSFTDAVANDTICYFVTGTIGDYNLWKTDGTVEGTENIASDDVQYSLSAISRLYLSNDKLFILVGHKLYATDGTAEGTILIPNEGGGQYEEIDVSGNELLFRNVNRDVWITDGTVTGTLKLPRPFGEYNYITSMTFTDEEVFAEYETSSFNGGNYVTTLHLVKLLNTSGVYSWKEIASHAGEDFVNNYEVYPASWNNSLFYWSNICRNNYVVSFDLRLTNGEVGDSKVIKRIQIEKLDEIITFKTSHLFYFICSKSSGSELWRSDGTEEGTFKLLDFSSAYYLSYQEHNRRLYFSVTHPDYGTELWETDGTVTGTKIRVDHLAGEQNSFISNLLVKGDTLFFSAYDVFSGNEYYTMPLGCDGEIHSVSSGNWHDQNIWSCGEIPKLMDYVTIKSGHKVIQDNGVPAIFKGLETESGAVLEIKNGSVFESNSKSY